MTHEVTALRTAAQQALEALNSIDVGYRSPSGDPLEVSFDEAKCEAAITALRAALAQQAEPAQEPVAWECKAGGLKPLTQRQYDAQTAATKRHYTRIAPPQRKPLTEEEIVDAVREADLDWQAGWTLDERAPNRFVTLARAAIAKATGEQP